MHCHRLLLCSLTVLRLTRRHKAFKTRLACSLLKAEARVANLGLLRLLYLVTHICKWKVRALEEVLIDLIFHKSINSVANAFRLRILKTLLRLNFKILCQVSCPVISNALSNVAKGRFVWAPNVFIIGNRAVTTIRVVTVVKLV